MQDRGSPDVADLERKRRRELGRVTGLGGLHDTKLMFTMVDVCAAWRTRQQVPDESARTDVPPEPLSAPVRKWWLSANFRHGMIVTSTSRNAFCAHMPARRDRNDRVAACIQL